MTRRILVLLLVASLCFAIFSIGVSAADTVSGSAVFLVKSPAGTNNVTLSLGESQSLQLANSRLTSMTVVLPSAGTAIFSLSGVGTSTVSGDGVTSTLSGSDLTVTVVGSAAGSVGITTSPGNSSPSTSISFSLVSWTPDGGGGGGSGDSSGSTSLSPSSGGYDGWNSDGTFTGSGNGISGTSQNWNIHSTYIGQLDYYVSDETGTLPAVVSIAKNLASVSQSSWSWKANADGTFTYVRPNPGSWFDNIWQMNIYLYYNLANQKGWFGHINEEFATLNKRVLQILSVLANDEDVKIKDATTDHRNWIIDFFEGENTGKPTTSDNDAVNDSMNTLKNQFQSSYTFADIGSIFTGNSYDNNIWYVFWSQAVFDDVNGVSRGGFGGNKAPARAPAVSSQSSWSSQYSYDDDSIPDMSGFGGGLCD